MAHQTYGGGTAATGTMPTGTSLAVIPGQGGKVDYWPLTKLRRAYSDYLFSKRSEIDEQIDARRYYHGSQWTREQIATLRKRRQPAMTFNRVARKIDSVVGTIEKMRQDPKAFPRTPQQSQGADLASAALRYVLDSQDWEALSPQVALDGAVDGIGGIELDLIQGDKGDPEIGMEPIDIASFFYDPHSYKDDFKDARYLGIGKWLDLDVAKDMFPDADEGAFSSDSEFTTSADKEARWFSNETGGKRVRVVEIWYQHKGGWCYAIFTGSTILMEGKSWLQDQKNKDLCKYVMFSGNVDQDGDRYGFVRNMKSAQDGLNAKQSKMQHILASKRIFITRGAVTDIEVVRKEAARPDGVVVVDRPVNEGLRIDDQQFDFAGMSKMLEMNIQEMENFGPNQALVGQGGVENSSGRAIALLQQAGIAELGPYIIAYRSWKLRVYRAIWNAVQRNWQGERWIRVTDDQQLAQFIQVNGVGIDPQTGQPQLVNALGQLDVDIILDEGPDKVNSMADVYETLTNVLPSIAPMLTPQKAQSVVDMLIESSPLPADLKKRFSDQSQQAQQQAMQPPPVPPEVQAMQAKAQIDMQSRESSMQMDLQAKHTQNQMEVQRAADANKSKWQSQQLDLAHQQEQQRLEREAMAAKCAMECDHMATKNDMTMQHERAKAEITTGTMHAKEQSKQRQMLAIADPEAAGELENLDAFKTLTDTFTQALDKIAKAIIAEQKQDDKPKKIDFTRDKTGKIAGATVQ